MRAPSFRLSKNLTILGPPGSGKGFYGRPLAEHFRVPLYTASSILRHRGRREDLDLTSGSLVDCTVVSSILREFLASREEGKEDGPRHYVLDGFPRTIEQIRLMERDWPVDHRVQYALHLDVPDAVCEQKMLGRRKCLKCGREVNVANVRTMGFDLPPQLPSTAPGDGCQGPGGGFFCYDPETKRSDHWTRRDDDAVEIARERLRQYRDLEGPILDHYRSRGRLLRYIPYRGELDVPDLLRTVQEWLTSIE